MDSERWMAARALPGTDEAPEPGQLPPPARAPRAEDDVLDWDGPERRVSRRWVLAMAVVPWAVLVVLVWQRGDPPDPGSGVAAATPDPSESESGVPAEATPVSPSPAASTPGAETLRSRALSGLVAPEPSHEVVGTATAFARTWLTQHADAAGGVSYVEHLVPEAVDRPGPGAAVVTLTAVVRTVDADEYGTPRAVRLAVPVTWSRGSPAPTGSAWWLPAPTVQPRAPELEPVTDPDLATSAIEAITAVGYRDVDLRELARSTGWFWVADVRAIGPGHDEAADHRLWLRVELGRLVLAGWSPSGPPRSAPSPSEVPS